ncbi:MAG: alpha/beta fold hydrolase [Segniliparus sp.]|uniref:alpha/beta fold hydrolase n=1 Tax=Segniliparus sp. TaxID=2804064 RepID=UPI003F3960AE
MSTGEIHAGGQRLKYAEFGSGSRTVVLAPPLLASHKAQELWARALAERGFRVIAIDLVADSVNGFPLSIEQYNTEALGRQLLVVLERLGVDRAVLGGTSLGANVALEAAAADPDRVAGLLLEGPILDDGVAAYGYCSSALLLLLTAGKPALWCAKKVARFVPQGRWTAADLLADLFVAPAERSRAVLHGLALGRMAPPKRVRTSVAVPALIMVLKADPFHPASDARRLCSELGAGQLLNIGTILTLRLRPKRVTPAIISFLNEVFGQVNDVRLS